MPSLYRLLNTTQIPHESNFFPVDFPEMFVLKWGTRAPQNYVYWFIKAYAHIYVQPRALNAFPANEKTCQINDP